MPNWCNNTLWLDGPAEDVEAFLTKHHLLHTANTELDFGIEVPVSDNASAEEHKAAWGTKWPGQFTVSATCHTRDGRRVETLRFDTAWNDPNTWATVVSAKYPTIKFTLAYYEEGNCFYGADFHYRGTRTKILYSEDLYEPEIEEVPEGTHDDGPPRTVTFQAFLDYYFQYGG